MASKQSNVVARRPGLEVGCRSWMAARTTERAAALEAADLVDSRSRVVTSTSHQPLAVHLERQLEQMSKGDPNGSSRNAGSWRRPAQACGIARIIR